MKGLKPTESLEHAYPTGPNIIATCFGFFTAKITTQHDEGVFILQQR